MEVLPKIQDINEIQWAVNDQAWMPLHIACPVLIVMDLVSIKGQSREAEEAGG
jgi:hypothetical protein